MEKSIWTKVICLKKGRLDKQECVKVFCCFFRTYFSSSYLTRVFEQESLGNSVWARVSEQKCFSQECLRVFGQELLGIFGQELIAFFCFVQQAMLKMLVSELLPLSNIHYYSSYIVYLLSSSDGPLAVSHISVLDCFFYVAV